MSDDGIVVASVIIPALNAAGTIAEQVTALLEQDPGFAWELVVCDNGSTDSTVSILHEQRAAHPEVALRIVEATEQPGAAYARNRGVSESCGTHVLFCDADDIVGTNWIREMVRALATADVVSGPTEMHRLNAAEVVAWRGEGDQTGLPGTVFLPAGYSANMGTTRAVFDAIGGFSLEFTGAAGEDLDFFWRAQLAGFSAGFAPGAVVHYRLRDDLRANARQAYYYGRSVPQLYRLHREHGMQRRSLGRSARQAAWVVVHAPDWFRGPARRGRWVWGASNLGGRIAGAWKYRVVSF